MDDSLKQGGFIDLLGKDQCQRDHERKEQGQNEPEQGRQGRDGHDVVQIIKHHQQRQQHHGKQTQNPVHQDAGHGNDFGAGIGPGEIVSLDDIATDPARHGKVKERPDQAEFKDFQGASAHALGTDQGAPSFAGQEQVQQNQKQCHRRRGRCQQVFKCREVQLSGLDQPVDDAGRKKNLSGLNQKLFGVFNHGDCLT